MTGVIIPLYSYPDSNWTNVIQVKRENPHVPFLVIVNPNNGPGLGRDPNYAKAIEQLQSMQIQVLGYTYTDYARRHLSEAILNINSYTEWYKVDGVCFDEMSNKPGYEEYYSELTETAKSLGCSITVGNAGTPTLPSYLRAVDNIVIYEGERIPSSDWLKSIEKNRDKNKFSYIAYGEFPFEISKFIDTLDYVSYVYVTDLGVRKAYNSLPVYFDLLIATLARSDQSLGAWSRFKLFPKVFSV